MARGGRTRKKLEDGGGGRTNGRPYPNGEGEWREKVLRQLIVDSVEEVVLSLLSFLYSSVFLSLHPPSPAAMRRERGCSRGGSGKKTIAVKDHDLDLRTRSTEPMILIFRVI